MYRAFKNHVTSLEMYMNKELKKNHDIKSCIPYQFEFTNCTDYHFECHCKFFTDVQEKKFGHQANYEKLSKLFTNFGESIRLVDKMDQTLSKGSKVQMLVTRLQRFVFVDLIYVIHSIYNTL